MNNEQKLIDQILKDWPNITPIKAAKQFCKIRCMNSIYEVKKCIDHKCPIWIYRHGKDPKRAKSYKTSLFKRNRLTGKRMPSNKVKKSIPVSISKGKVRLPDGEYELRKLDEKK